jgi:hypothetical protein
LGIEVRAKSSGNGATKNAKSAINTARIQLLEADSFAQSSLDSDRLLLPNTASHSTG